MSHNLCIRNAFLATQMVQMTKFIKMQWPWLSLHSVKCIILTWILNITLYNIFGKKWLKHYYSYLWIETIKQMFFSSCRLPKNGCVSYWKKPLCTAGYIKFSRDEHSSDYTSSSYRDIENILRILYWPAHYTTVTLMVKLQIVCIALLSLKFECNWHFFLNIVFLFHVQNIPFKTHFSRLFEKQK